MKQSAFFSKQLQCQKKFPKFALYIFFGQCTSFLICLIHQKNSRTVQSTFSWLEKPVLYACTSQHYSVHSCNLEKPVLYACTSQHYSVHSCNLEKQALVSFSKTSKCTRPLDLCAILIVFEKLTRACFFQVRRETIILLIYLQ